MVLEYLAQFKLRGQHRTILTYYQLIELPHTINQSIHTIHNSIILYKLYIVNYINEYKQQRLNKQTAQLTAQQHKLQQAKLLLSQVQHGNNIQYDIDDLLAQSDDDDNDVLDNFNTNILDSSFSEQLLQSFDLNHISTQFQSITNELYQKAITVLTPSTSTNNTPVKQHTAQSNIENIPVVYDRNVPSAPPMLSPMSPPTSRVKKSGLKNQANKQSLFNNDMNSMTGSTAFPTVPTPVSQSPLLQHCVQKRSNSIIHTNKSIQNNPHLNNDTVVIGNSAPPPPPPPMSADYTKSSTTLFTSTTGDNNKENEYDDDDNITSLESTSQSISARKELHRISRNTIMSPSNITNSNKPTINTDSLQQHKSQLKSVHSIQSNNSMPGTDTMSLHEQIKFVAKLKVLKKIDLQRSPGGTPARSQYNINNDADTLKHALFTKFRNTGLRDSTGRISTGVTPDAWDT